MNGTDLPARHEVISTYTSLFTGLANLIDHNTFIDIVEQLRKGRFMVATMDVWDELLELAKSQHNPGLSYIAAAHAGESFDYEAYAACVGGLDAVKLGGFLWSWERARVTLGGQLKLNQIFRLMKGAELDRMVAKIYQLIEEKAA